MKKQKIVEALTEDEVRVIKDKVNSNIATEKKKPYVVALLLCHTGIRVSELCDLTWEDVNSDYIVIKKGKGDKLRQVPLSDDANFCFNWLDEKYPSKKYVLETAGGKQYYRQYVNYMIKKLNAKYHPHLFRHTFATILMRRNVDVKRIQTILGHSSVNITMNIYMHPTMEDLRDAVKAL